MSPALRTLHHQWMHTYEEEPRSVSVISFLAKNHTRVLEISITVLESSPPFAIQWLRMFPGIFSPQSPVSLSNFTSFSSVNASMGFLLLHIIELRAPTRPTPGPVPPVVQVVLLLVHHNHTLWRLLKSTAQRVHHNHTL